MTKKCTKSVTLLGAGWGGKRNFVNKRFCGHLGVSSEQLSWHKGEKRQKLSGSKLPKQHQPCYFGCFCLFRAPECLVPGWVSAILLPYPFPPSYPFHPNHGPDFARTCLSLPPELRWGETRVLKMDTRVSKRAF